jgi:purine-binding chemotaxis protein CheW
VPVIDFSRFMGHAARPITLQQKLIILKEEDRRVALIVDQVDGIEDWSGELLALPHLKKLAADTHADMLGVLLGEVRQGDDIVMLVNALSLLEVPANWPAQGERAGLSELFGDTLQTQVFHARMHQLAQVTAPEDVQGQVQFAVVSTGSRLYAIHLEQIVEFTQLLQYTVLPESPPSIVGCMNLRGEILSIVDIGVLVGADPSPRNANVVVLQHQGHKFSCLIQSIERLVSVPEHNVVAMHDNEDLHPLAKTLLRHGSDVTTILNLEAIVALCGEQQKIQTQI